MLKLLNDVVKFNTRKILCWLSRVAETILSSELYQLYQSGWGHKTECQVNVGKEQAAALEDVVRKEACLKLPSLTSGGVFDAKIFSYLGSFL